MKHVRRTLKYAVSGSNVQLAILIGSGQIGSSVVYRADDELARGSTLLSVALGRGDALVRTRIEAWSFVQDVLAQTNRVSVEYVLTGGAEPQRTVVSANLSKHLDLCRFTTTIRFVAP